MKSIRSLGFIMAFLLSSVLLIVTPNYAFARSGASEETSDKPNSSVAGASSGLLTIPPTSFVPADAAVSPDHDTLSLLDTTGCRVVFADLSAGTLTPVSLPSAPKKVIYAGGSWLVAMAGSTSSTGRVAVVDPATLTVSGTINTDIALSGVTGDANYIYVYNTSIGIEVYSRDTGAKVSSISSYCMGDLEVNPVNGLLYAIWYYSPASFQVTDGQITLLNRNQSYYGSSITVMPDGKHMLLYYGAVCIALTCQSDQNPDLQYVTTIQGGSPIATDSINNELDVVSERLIQVYDASDFAFKRVIPETQATSYLFCSCGKLISGQKDASNVLTFKDADAGALLKTVKFDGDAFSELFPLHFTMDRGTVPYAMASTDIEAVPAFDNAVVSGDVGTVPLAVGMNTFTVTVQNPSSGCTQTYTITMTRQASDPPQQTYNAFTNLGFLPLDAVVDPDRSDVYMTAKDSQGKTQNLLYRVDLQTGAITQKEFSLPAESITVVNGKIYVTLLRTGHHYYGDSDSIHGYGAVAVVDTNTFKVDSIFNTNIDPYDIEADKDGYVYLAPGSYQWSILASYDSETGRPVASQGNVYQNCIVKINPVSSKLYLLTHSSPSQIYAYELENGEFWKSYGSPYWGNYYLYPDLVISPDGRFLFNSSGHVFQSAPTQTGDMIYVSSIHQYNAICFQPGTGEFFTADDKTLRTYNYSTFHVTDSESYDDHLASLFEVDGKPIALHMDSSNAYYLKWINFCTVTFDSQGGSAVAPIKVLQSSKIANPAPPTRTGYSFGGWYKDAACTNAWYFNNDVVTADTTLYAKWTIARYTVLFDAQGGSAVGSIQADYDTKITAPANPARTGYTFGGWYKEAACANAWNFDADLVTSNITLYAKWTIDQYTVTFDSEGGSDIGSIQANYGSKIAAPAAPVRAGYTFVGWYKDEACSQAWNFSKDTVTADITLHAKWTPTYPLTLSGIMLSAGTLSPAFSRTRTSYTVNLGENDGSVTVTPVKAYAESSMTIDGENISEKQVSMANGASVPMKVVVSYGGKSKTYMLTIKRAKSTDDLLASLSATKGAFDRDFDAGVTQYTLTLEEDTASTTITASADSPLARITNGTKTLTLKNNQTVKYTITVKSQAGATKKYTVTVFRKPSTSANPSISRTNSTRPLSSAFDEDTLEYALMLLSGAEGV